MSHGGSEPPATHFAITTVNVPDRLDLQDMDDRKQFDDDNRARGFDMGAFRAWAPRLVLLGVVCAIAFFLFELIDTWRTSLSPEQLTKRLTASLGVPVQVEASQFSINPAPRLILKNVAIDKKIVLESISVNIGTKHIAQVLQGRGWNWGEAVVGPTTITLEQGQALIGLLPRLDAALPRSLSSVRFEGLEIADEPWLIGKWDAALVRTAGTGFSTVSAEQRNDKGSLQIQLQPTADPQVIAFQLEARNWVLPVGPNFPVEEAVASGMLSTVLLDMSQFSIGGPFGAVRGHISASWNTNWSVEGVAQTEGMDLESLIRQISPTKTADEASQEPPTVIQGTASFAGKIEGKGATLPEAANAAVLVAPVHVRSPVLNGINLGYAATHPGSGAGSDTGSGGSTRFSALDAVVEARANMITFREIRAHAGALAAFGQISMSPSHTLSGQLHVDLGSTRVLAPIRVGVHGTVVDPKFGR